MLLSTYLSAWAAHQIHLHACCDYASGSMLTAGYSWRIWNDHWEKTDCHYKRRYTDGCRWKRRSGADRCFMQRHLLRKAVQPLQKFSIDKDNDTQRPSKLMQVSPPSGCITEFLSILYKRWSHWPQSTGNSSISGCAFKTCIEQILEGPLRDLHRSYFKHFLWGAFQKKNMDSCATGLIEHPIKETQKTQKR